MITKNVPKFIVPPATYTLELDEPTFKALKKLAGKIGGGYGTALYIDVYSGDITSHTGGPQLRQLFSEIYKFQG